MRVIAVTRHAGASEWLANNGYRDAIVTRHLDPRLIMDGDIVVGTLPLQLVEVVLDKGGRYKHLSMAIPESHRGKELTVQEMDSFGCHLIEYNVERLGEE